MAAYAIQMVFAGENTSKIHPQVGSSVASYANMNR